MFGGAGAHGGDQSALGDDIDRGQRLGQRNRTAEDGKRNRRRQLHLARAFNHARERRQPVKPRCLEDEVVVGRNGREPAVSGRIDGRLQAPAGERLPTELHQRQMDGKLHGPMLSAFRSSGNKIPGPHWTKRSRIPDLTHALHDAEPAIKRRAVRGLRPPDHPRQGRTAHRDLATVTETVANALENTKALHEGGLSVTAGEVAGARYVRGGDASRGARVKRIVAITPA